MKHLNIILIFVATLSLVSCNEDYLDANPTSEVSSDKLEEIVAKNPAALNNLLSGVYTTMYTAGSGGTDLDHDDFGQKGYDIFTDMLSADMALAGTNYGWYTRIVRLQATVNFADIANYKPWRYYYRIILSTNQIIGALGGNDAVLATDDAKYIMGQAKAMRGYAYFYLTQLYQKGYDPNEEILPIYIDTEAPNQPKSKASDVYALIEKDLSEAVVLLEGYTRPNKSSINKSVAQGLLAYAYGAQGKYAKVAEVTSKVISQGGFPLTQSSALAANLDPVSGKLLNPESGFNDVNTPSWMWGIDLTSSNDLDLVSWWGQMDYYTYSYAWAGDPKVIDKSLYDKISASDVRKKQFSSSSGRPLYKFFDPNRKAGGQRTITTDYIYMRIEEMYLLDAEAKAKTNDEAGAKTRLKELLSTRNVNVAYIDGLSGASLQQEIYLQTRIELWGEGKSYLAMKRNKATTVRGERHLFLVGESIPYNDERLTFKIPQNEILNNPFIN
jgi:hypothetical protein